jgi:regulatory protein
MPLTKAKSYALRLLAIRPRSVNELRNKLTLKGYVAEDIEVLIQELKQKKLLDDLEFSRCFLRSRIAHNPKGAAFLKIELRQKGIGEEDLEESLKELAQVYDQKAVALKIACSRTSRWGDLDKEKSKRRIRDFLTRRGFSPNIVYEVIKELYA